MTARTFLAMRSRPPRWETPAYTCERLSCKPKHFPPASTVLNFVGSPLAVTVNFFRVSFFARPADANGSRVGRARVTCWRDKRTTYLTVNDLNPRIVVLGCRQSERILTASKIVGRENRGRRWLPRNYRTVRGHRPTVDGSIRLCVSTCRFSNIKSSCRPLSHELAVFTRGGASEFRVLHVMLPPVKNRDTPRKSPDTWTLLVFRNVLKRRSYRNVTWYFLT